MILSTHTPNPKLTSYRWQGAVFHFLKASSGRSFLSVSKTNTSPQQSSLTERAWLTCRKRPYLQGPRRAGFRTHRLVSGPCQTCQHKTRREQAAGTFPSVSPQDLRCCQGRAKGATLPFFPPNPHTSEEWRPPPISFRTGNRSVLLPTFSAKGNHFLQTAISDPPPPRAQSGSPNFHDSSVITHHTLIGQDNPQPGSQPNPQNLP